MSRWLFEKSHLEQALAKSPNPPEEASLRKRTIAFMQEAGQKLNLPQIAIATAIVFFQRYYALRTVATPDRVDMATTALFLASKVEDVPKKLTDVIRAARRLHDGVAIEPSSPEFAAIRDRVLQFELDLLKHLSFDMTVEHPYKMLVGYVKKLRTGARDPSGDGVPTSGEAKEREEEEYRKLAQDAWNFVNDSYRTNLSLRFPPQMIAIATLYLAHRRRKKLMTVPGDKPWWVVFDVRIEVVDEICEEIISLYDKSPIDGSSTAHAVGKSPASSGPSPSPSPAPLPPGPPPSASPPPPPPPLLPPKPASPKTRPSEGEAEQREKHRPKQEQPEPMALTAEAPTKEQAKDVEMKERSESLDRSHDRHRSRERKSRDGKDDRREKSHHDHKREHEHEHKHEKDSRGREKERDKEPHEKSRERSKSRGKEKDHERSKDKEREHKHEERRFHPYH